MIKFIVKTDCQIYEVANDEELNVKTQALNTLGISYDVYELKTK